MEYSYLILILLFVFFLFFSFRNFIRYASHKEELTTRVSEIIDSGYHTKKRKTSPKERLLEQTFRYADDFASLGHRINFFSESQEVKRWLMQAGYPYKLTVERFQGLKIFLLLMGFVFGVAAFILGFPFGQFLLILAPLGGYFGSILWLKGKAKERQNELSYSLPDFLDTMSVTLQAGIGLDQALREITPYFPGPVEEEFSRFIQEIDIGVTREKAYRSLLDRNDNQEFQSLIKSLIQGERLGVPISMTFKVQAEEMRKIKKEKVKELAAKASPKVTLITTFIVMPTAMILIGGLMIMNMFMGDNNLLQLFKN